MSTDWMAAKTTEAAPTPMEMERSATTVTVGVRRRSRSAWRISWRVDMVGLLDAAVRPGVPAHRRTAG